MGAMAPPQGPFHASWMPDVPGPADVTSVEMPVDPSRAFRWSRESRLLVLTVAVCAVALLFLARLRFPEPPPVVNAATPPLERLAARASYDALAADIERVESLIASHLIVVRVAPPVPVEPRRLDEALAMADSPSRVRHVPALRLRPDAAVAVVDRGARIDGIVGAASADGTAAVRAINSVRHLALVRVPEMSVRPLSDVRLEALQTPLYVVVVEGTQAGVTLRPVFLGRGDLFTSPRWSRPLLPLGGVAATPGALLFTLAGEFIGVAVMENGALAIAGAADVLATADALSARGTPEPSESGIIVQRLTAALASALGVDHGVVVSDVDPEGTAAGLLEPMDVVTAVDGRPTLDPDELLLNLGSRPPGESAALTITRQGVAMEISLPLEGPPPAPATPEPLAFAAERGVGTRVQIGSDWSGLRAGDLVLRAGTTNAPTPAQLRRLLGAPTESGFITLIIRRDGRQRVVAVAVGRRGDDASR
ncbi:MAG: PDZ domain-containing protein [Vicinamibacterales bacterium]